MKLDPRVMDLFEYGATEFGIADRVVEERLRKVASNMLRKGADVEYVAECTGLDIADVVMIASAQV